MRDGNGYILPENPTPESLRCLKVWIPDDPRYLEAFSGQFHDMGTWLVWEKDGTNRASLAADAWKDAIDYTYENGWLNCGDDMDCCQEILDRLTDIEESIKNQTCTCGSTGTGGGNNNMCCCCGCGNNNQTTEPPNPDDYIDPPPPPSVDPPPIVDDEWKCQASNQAVDDFIGYWTDVGNGVALGGNIIDILGGAALTYFLIVGATVWIVAIAAVLAAVAAIVLSDKVLGWFVFHRDNLVCLIYNAPTPAFAKSAYMSYVETNGSIPTGGATGGLVKLIAQHFGEMVDWNKIFQPGSFFISPANQTADCTECAYEPPPDPDPGNEPPGDPEESAFVFVNPVIAADLTLANGYQILHGEPILLNAWYGIRAKHISGQTWSGWRTQIAMAVTGSNDPSLIDNLKVVISDTPGLSGNHDGVADVLRITTGGQDIWTDLTNLPTEIVGCDTWRVYDSDGEFDVWFWFEMWP